jgi:hypothetical protein
MNVRSQPPSARVGDVSTSESPVPEFLRGLVDDAAIFPPGNAPIEQALRANRTLRQRTRYVDVVGTFVVDDRRLPELDEAMRAATTDDLSPDDPLRVNVVVTGGAGALEPAVRWTSSSRVGLAGLEIALRDSAPG